MINFVLSEAEVDPEKLFSVQIWTDRREKVTPVAVVCTHNFHGAFTRQIQADHGVDYLLRKLFVGGAQVHRPRHLGSDTQMARVMHLQKKRKEKRAR